MDVYVGTLVSHLLGPLKFASVTLHGRGGTHACTVGEKGLELMSFSSNRIDTALMAVNQILVSITSGAYLSGSLMSASVTLHGRGGTHACPAGKKGLELIQISSSRIDTALMALSQILVSITRGAVITQNLYLLGSLMSASATLPGKSSAHACIAGEGAGERVKQQHWKAHCKEALPVRIINVCFGDAPWQGRHACMHRGREGAGVDVILKQQHLCLSVLVAYRAQGAHIVPGGIG